MAGATTEADLERWEGMVRGIAARLCGRRGGDTFEDLCQEGRIALVQFIPQVNGKKGAAGTYLYRCVEGVMLRWWRDQGYTIRVAAWRHERGERIQVGEMPERGLGPHGASHQDTENTALHHVEVEQAIQTAGLTWYEQRCLVALERPHEGHLTKAQYMGAARARRKLRAARDGTPEVTRASVRALKRRKGVTGGTGAMKW